MAGTLVVFYPGCIELEVMLAAEVLHPHLPVSVATPDGADYAGSNGMRYRADLAYAQVRPDDFRVVLVPGGDPESVLGNAALDALLRGADRQGALIGAICAGPLVAAQAGLLVGKRFTHGYKDLYQEFLAPFWQGAVYVDDLVVRDGGLFTAQAEGHVDFAVELMFALGLVDERERERKRRFYKGVR